MTIDNLLNWLQEAEDNNIFMVSTQSVKRHLEKIQKEQLILYGVIVPKGTFNCGQERAFGEEKCKQQCKECLVEYNDN